MLCHGFLHPQDRLSSPVRLSRISFAVLIATTLCLTDASLVDVEANKVRPGMTVTIENGHFKDVHPTSLSDADSFPPDCRVIDLEGLYLCPGLIDCRRFSIKNDSCLSLCTQTSTSTFPTAGRHRALWIIICGRPTPSNACSAVASRPFETLWVV